MLTVLSSKRESSFSVKIPYAADAAADFYVSCLYGERAIGLAGLRGLLGTGIVC